LLQFATLLRYFCYKPKEILHVYKHNVQYLHYAEKMSMSDNYDLHAAAPQKSACKDLGQKHVNM